MKDIIDLWRSDAPESRARGSALALEYWKRWTPEDLALLRKGAKDKSREVAVRAKEMLHTILTRRWEKGKPKPKDNDLVFVVAQDGTCTMGSTVLFKVTDKGDDDTARLEKFFEVRRYDRKLQAIPGRSDWVNYTLFLRVHPLTPFFHIHRILIIVPNHGGVTRVVLTSDETDDYAAVILPRPVAPKDERITPLEARISICSNGGFKEHRLDRVTHWRKKKELKECRVAVAKDVVGRLSLLGKGSEVPNRLVIQKAVDRLKRFRGKTGKEGKMAIEVDPDREIPFQQVLRVLSLLRKDGYHAVRISPNPGYDKYYGTYQKGQFKRN